MISQLTGYPGVRLHNVYLGTANARHAVELLQYLEPVGGRVAPTERNNVGTTHIGIIVDDLDSLYQELSAKGVKFVNPPAVRPNASYPWAQKACYLQDPDGNWLEFIEREPTPPDATVV